MNDEPSLVSHHMKLSVSPKDASIWLGCSCGHSERLGEWPDVEDVQNLAWAHTHPTPKEPR